MKIINEIIRLNTIGNPDLVDITKQLSGLLSSSKLKKGNVTIFVVGSTAAVTTFEYESGLIKDMQDLYDKLIPSKRLAVGGM